MRRMLWAVAVALLIVIIPLAYGAGTSATVSWTPPSQYTDNSPLPVADILQYIVKWDAGQQAVLAPATSVVLNIPCGTTAFSVVTVTKSTAKYPNTSSDDSAPSALYATGVTCRPKPASGVTAS